MKINELQDLHIEDLISILRRHGIRTITFGGTSITLGTAPLKESPTEALERDIEEEKLSCGHSLWEANSIGECLHGCLKESSLEETK